MNIYPNSYVCNIFVNALVVILTVLLWHQYGGRSKTSIFGSVYIAQPYYLMFIRYCVSSHFFSIFPSLYHYHLSLALVYLSFHIPFSHSRYTSHTDYLSLSLSLHIPYCISLSHSLPISSTYISVPLSHTLSLFLILIPSLSSPYSLSLHIPDCISLSVSRLPWQQTVGGLKLSHGETIRSKGPGRGSGRTPTQQE